ncbi:MAG: S66 peptidase family protein, partial [Longimicrobiales bacterium]
GAMRTLAAMDGLPPTSRPYIGFSDNTAVHLALLRARVVSFHGPHAGGELSPFAESVLRRVLFTPEPAGTLSLPADAPVPMALVSGSAEGELVGGNLSLLASLIGTPWPLDARGRILFIEEVGESFYRLDRMLMQLRLAGSLDGVAGVVLGQFTQCASDDCERSLDALLRDLLAPLGVPVGYGYPFGHVADNWTLPVGVRAHFDADAGTLTLLEPAVA